MPHDPHPHEAAVVRAHGYVVANGELGAGVGFGDQSGAAPVAHVAARFGDEGDVGCGRVLGHAQAKILLRADRRKSDDLGADVADHAVRSCGVFEQIHEAVVVGVVGGFGEEVVLVADIVDVEPLRERRGVGGEVEVEEALCAGGVGSEAQAVGSAVGDCGGGVCKRCVYEAEASGA